MRRELRLQKKIVRLIKEAGGEARIVTQSAWTTTGDGDVIGCLRGRFLYLEAKDGEEYKATKIQLHRLRGWRKAGAHGHVITSLIGARKVIDHILAAYPDYGYSTDG